MREYLRIRNAAAIFLAAYFGGGLATLLLPRMEVFPVYSWFLFSLVPQKTSQYALVLTEVNGQKLTPPRLYQEADGIVTAPHSVTAFKLTQQFGAAITRGANADTARGLLERDWLPPKTRYQLVAIKADPVARWKNGEYEIIRHIGDFTSTGALP